MKLDKSTIEIGNRYKTPFLLMDLNILRDNYRKIKASIDDVEVFYAMKANDHPKVLEVLREEGSSFEISSLAEMNSLLKLDIPAEKIMCFNSIKNPEFLQAMEEKGVHIMAFDSESEVDKIAKYAPSAQLVLRVIVNNEGSDWPLTKKFGVDVAEAIPMLRYAKKKGLNPIGVTFHVGSQCLNKGNWASALYVCKEIWKQAKNEGIHLNFLSLGGGMPVQHLKKIPSIEEIGKVVNRIINKNIKNAVPNLRVTIEPGRGLVGDTAILVTEVVGDAKRGIEDWMYIDVGVFNGLMETIENFAYEIKTETNRKPKRVTIAGPSCDSVDIPFKNIRIAEAKIGERLYIMNAGAYTTVYAAPFNGFAVPVMHFINE